MQTKYSIVLRNIIFFLLSFTNYAMLVVIPQIFFLNHYSNSKDILLSLFLLLGAFGGIIGVNLSSRFNNFTNNKTIIVIILTLISTFFLSFFILKNIFIYFISFFIFKFLLGYIFNFIDLKYAYATSNESLHFHSNINILYQILGIVLSVFYFSFFYEKFWLHLVIIIILTFISIYAMNRELNKNEYRKTNNIATYPLSKYDIYFLGHVVFFIIILTIITTFFMYILNDFYEIKNVQKSNGILLGIANLSSVLSIFIFQFIKKEKINIYKFLEFGILIWFIASILFYIRLSTSMFYLASITFTLGFLYGLFLILTRIHITYETIHNKKTKFLSFYNNIFNYALIGAYLISLIISLFKKNTSSFINILFNTVIVLLFICFLFLLSSGKNKILYSKNLVLKIKKIFN